MTEQAVGFLTNEVLEGRSQFEVNAGHNQFLVVLSVHDAAIVLGCLIRRIAESGKVVVPRIPVPGDALEKLSAIIVTGGSSEKGKPFIEHVGK